MPQKYELVGNPTITKRVNKLINKKNKIIYCNIVFSNNIYHYIKL